jgi:F0F1-type ATP synthase assembly protein I
MPTKDAGCQELVRYLKLVIQLAVTMSLCIGSGFLVGLLLDSKFSTKGILLTLFILVGIVAGFRSVYRQIMKA